MDNPIINKLKEKGYDINELLLNEEDLEELYNTIMNDNQKIDICMKNKFENDSQQKSRGFNQENNYLSINNISQIDDDHNLQQIMLNSITKKSKKMTHFSNYLDTYKLNYYSVPSQIYEELFVDHDLPKNVKNLKYTNLLIIIKGLLKKHNHTYEECRKYNIQIIYDLFGLYPFDFIQENKQIFLIMFNLIEKICNEISPIKYSSYKNPKFNNSYILYKIVELLNYQQQHNELFGWTDLIHMHLNLKISIHQIDLFYIKLNKIKIEPLKKPSQNISTYEKDCLWNIICSKLNWLFIPTINISDSIMFDLNKHRVGLMRYDIDIFSSDIIILTNKIYDIIKQKDFIISDSKYILLKILEMYETENLLPKNSKLYELSNVLLIKTFTKIENKREEEFKIIKKILNLGKPTFFNVLHDINIIYN